MSTPWLTWKTPQESAGFQGIDYLELVLLPTPEAPTHAELVVHLHATSPSPFTAKSFSISGGIRIKDIPWTIASQNAAARTVTLELDDVGDASPYVLRLLDGAGLPVHPFFAEASFVFTIDCERGDCRPLAEEPPRAKKQRPSVDLLTKDYTGFVQLLAEWTRVHNPHLADLSPASLERVLLELLAHHGDMLSYYQDRVANEAFIDTASQRYSLHQHATLLGTKLFDGTAAETTLAFTASNDGYVPMGTEVTRPEGAGDAEVVFYVAERTRVLADHSRLPLAAWPQATDAIVPRGATEILLWGTIDGLLPGQRIAFVEGDFTTIVSFSQIVTITSVRHDRLPGWVASPFDPAHTNLSDVTIVAFDPPLARDLRPWDTSGKAVTVFGNLGSARFGRASHPDLSTFTLDEATFANDPQSAVVERRPDSPYPLLRALRLPESPVVFEAIADPSGAIRSRPVISVTVDGEQWDAVEHLHNSRSYDRHFVASADEDGSLWLELGDGTNGRALELAGQTMRVDYRVGHAIAGNVGIGVLTRFVPGRAPSGFTDIEVVNVVPGTGGRGAESKDAARLRVPASLRHGPLERAVALEDYARVAQSVPGVARASAKYLGGPFNAVLVLVDPVGQNGASDALLSAVYDRIDALRMAGREHFVRAAEYVPLEVQLAICVEPGSMPHRVRDAVLAALRPGSDTNPGFFHPDRLSFGDDLDLGDLLAHVQRVPGVRSVKALRFRKLGVATSGPVESRIVLGPTEVIRLDGDDAVPENGKLKVLIVGIDPGVKETDFVIEETSP